MLDWGVMSMILTPRGPDATDLKLSGWHWRVIVEAIRDLAVLDDARVDGLHKAGVGALTQEEARSAAAGLRDRLLPTLAPGERLLLNGEKTTEPDDQVFHRAREDQWRNYSTDLPTLTLFVEFCERSGGFSVRE